MHCMARRAGIAKATKRVSHAYSRRAPRPSQSAPTQNDPHKLRRLRRPTGPRRAAILFTVLFPVQYEILQRQVPD